MPNKPLPRLSRTITYPLEAVREISNRLCDYDWNLPGDEADDRATGIVIDVTRAVDALRAREGQEMVPDALRKVVLGLMADPGGCTFNEALRSLLVDLGHLEASE